MEVEETKMIDGVMPEQSRAILTAFSLNNETCQIVLQCVLKNGGPNGSHLWKEKLIFWNTRVEEKNFSYT